MFPLDTVYCEEFLLFLHGAPKAMVLFHRVLWNQIEILLSVAINTLMLVTWNAKESLDDEVKERFAKNNTAILAALNE